MVDYPGQHDINIVNDVVINFDKHINSISMGEEMIKSLLASSLLGIPLSPECEKGSMCVHDDVILRYLNIGTFSYIIIFLPF